VNPQYGPQYNPPPNWPPPPPGWTPPTGWQPDPAWPSAPAGWQFWVTPQFPPPPQSVPTVKRHLWLAIGLPVTLGVLLLAGLISVGIYSVTHPMSRARAAATSYAQALQDKRYPAAYAMLCAQDQLGQDRYVQTWTKAAAGGRGIASFQVTGVDVQSVNGRSSAQAEITVRYGDGTNAANSLYLVKSGKTWHPCP
jgi:hypothetical protein